MGNTYSGKPRKSLEKPDFRGIRSIQVSVFRPALTIHCYFTLNIFIRDCMCQQKVVKGIRGLEPIYHGLKKITPTKTDQLNYATTLT
jgi:hypothetical protein